MDTIADWQGLVEREAAFHDDTEEWVFRGQPSPRHRLKSTLERASHDFSVPHDTVAAVEKALTVDFRRSCQIYGAPVVPAEHDTLSWVALMRHYGAPTRFVDFTYSLFMAVYFASEVDEAEPFIWAVSKTWLGKNMERLVTAIPDDGQALWEGWQKRDGAVYERLFLDREPPLDFVAAINPMLMNDRLLVQQGVFLAATDVTRPFHEALEAMPGSEKGIRCFGLEGSARTDVLMRLHRLGVNRATLFPGLQGYAESLRSKIPIVMWLKELRDRGSRVGPEIIGV